MTPRVGENTDRLSSKRPEPRAEATAGQLPRSTHKMTDQAGETSAGKARIERDVMSRHRIPLVALSILALLVAAVCSPLTGVAQPRTQVPKVGVIGERGQADPFLDAFRQGLRELGYTEGHNIVVE